MKKWIIYLITTLAMVSIATALIDCERTVTTQDLPCMITSSWDYPNSCNTYTIRFWNSSGTLTGQHEMTQFGSTGRCNATFNFTIVDSYIYNISGGDSGRIIVEVDEKMNIAIAIGLSIFAVLFIVIGLYLFFNGRKDND